MIFGRERTQELIREWYRDLDYPTGGAFHVVLDDLNVSDDLILWCWEERRTYGCPPEHDDIMAAIRDGLLAVPEDEREDLIRGAA
jgi:hypothetical protein